MGTGVLTSILSVSGAVVGLQGNTEEGDAGEGILRRSDGAALPGGSPQAGIPVSLALQWPGLSGCRVLEVPGLALPMVADSVDLGLGASLALEPSPGEKPSPDVNSLQMCSVWEGVEPGSRFWAASCPTCWLCGCWASLLLSGGISLSVE